MMQKLDNNIQAGRSGGEMARKVEEMLKSETTSFFNRVANINIKKWVPLIQKIEFDSGSLIRECREKEILSNSAGNPPAKITSLDLDIEEMRLEEDYCRNWIRHEGFHLQEAFRSQQIKLDREWAIYTDQLVDAINVKKKALLGNRSNDDDRLVATDHSRAHGDDRQFHHPEKQKTLFNTVPVMAPQFNAADPRKSQQKAGTAAGSAVKAVRSGKEEAQLQMELRRLDSHLETAMAALQTQKAQAAKWMNQQNVRIMIQAEETKAAKAAVADLFRFQRELLRALAAIEGRHQHSGR